MRYLSLAEVLELHRRITALSGGAAPLRDLGALIASNVAHGGKRLGTDIRAGIGVLHVSASGDIQEEAPLEPSHQLEFHLKASARIVTIGPFGSVGEQV
jgi:hypothetical protein